MATDREIREAGFKYIPPQEFLLNPFKIPTKPEEPVTDSGIVILMLLLLLEVVEKIIT